MTRLVLCVKGRQQRGLTLPLQIETKPQKRKRGLPVIQLKYPSKRMAPNLRMVSLSARLTHMQSRRLYRQHETSETKKSFRACLRKRSDLWSDFFVSRRVCVWQRLRIHTHTSASPVYPLLHAPSIRPWNNSSACSPQKNLIHKQQNIQAPIIWQTDPPKDTNIHRASFAWRQSYIQYVQTWSRSNLCIPFSLYLHLTSGNLSWLLFFFDWICAILMKPLKCKELPLTAFVNNG